MKNFLQTVSALNDETRLTILRFIDLNGSVCVCDIEAAFCMIQSRISRHLKILKEAGFLRVKRQGRWAFYSIRSPLDKFRQDILKEISYLEMHVPQLEKHCRNNIKETHLKD
ncbi:MAG TPA: metalloregulator ArsR/SmtB family transcription factor [Sulfurovum sp.]|nr:metalloregulator ArsR/SmtB family transcription factor [Sulfurovum sp.]